VYSTEEERTRAQTQLDKLLAVWQARLRAQENERVAEIRRQRVEEPQRAREAGEADLRRDLDRLRHEQRSVLELIWQQHRARIRQDFGADTARLSIVLPAASLAAQTTVGTGVPTTTATKASNFIETNLPALSSVSAISGGALPRNGLGGVSIAVNVLRTGTHSAGRETIVRALRAQAWREARRQAQWAARRFGWRWQPTSVKAVSAPDRTREVLQWLSD
jgi:hypothetical protein